MTELKVNFTRLVLKPMLESKLKLKKAYKVFFKAYKKKDRIELEGFGMLKGSIIFGTTHCEPIKITENENYERMLISNLNKEAPDWKEWDVCYLTIDYELGIIKTEVWYISKNNAPLHRVFANEF